MGQSTSKQHQNFIPSDNNNKSLKRLNTGCIVDPFKYQQQNDGMTEFSKEYFENFENQQEQNQKENAKPQKKNNIKQIKQNQVINIKLTWTNHKVNQQQQEEEDIDLDLSCCFIDIQGQITDTVFYNQVKSQCESVTHSGDQISCQQQENKSEEIIRIDISKIPKHDYIHNLSIIVCSHNQQLFRNISNVCLTVEQENTGIIQQLQIQDLGGYTSFLCGFFYFQPEFQQWVYFEDSQLGNGKTFEDCQSLIYKSMTNQGYDPGVLVESKNWKIGQKKYSLTKNQSINIPKNYESHVKLGLGWDAANDGIDVDASILMLDDKFEVVKIVSYAQLNDGYNAVSHYGDNLTGEGEGDDEVIAINLSNIPDKIHTLWPVVNVYSNGKQFDDIQNCFCRLLVQDKEMAHFNLSDNADGVSNGLIVGSFQRQKGEIGLWYFTAKGYYMENTKVAKDSHKFIKDISSGNYKTVKIIDPALSIFNDGLEVNQKKKKQCINFQVKSIQILQNDVLAIFKNDKYIQASMSIFINKNQQAYYNEKLKLIINRSGSIELNKGVQVYIQENETLWVIVQLKNQKKVNLKLRMGLTMDQKVIKLDKLGYLNLKYDLDGEYNKTISTMGKIDVQIQKQNY